jgi:hypothetical protein
MSKTTIVLIKLDKTYELIEEDKGVAFSIGRLEHENYEIIYVATSKQDAEAAIAHYTEHKNFKEFVSAENYR